MKKTATKLATIILLLCLAGLGYWSINHFPKPDSAEESIKETLAELSEEGEEAEEGNRQEAKKARYEYFFKLLRDPETNSIPENIRARELRHARPIPSFREVQQAIKSQTPNTQVAEGFNWQLAGPPAVGGRTRALGIDQRNSNIVIAGGVSGGIWKSTDGGDNWTLRTPDFESFSVTSLAQDPTSPDTWYYAGGEFLGNSANAPGAIYRGPGIFKSTDNGDTWTQIPGTGADDNGQFDSRFDYISKIVVSPATGSVFFSSNGFGVYRSTDGENFSSNPVIGTVANQLYSTVDVAPNGRLVAVISSESYDSGSEPNNPGVFVSDDDGDSWTDVTPGTFPSEYARSVATFAPSNPDILYVFTNKTGSSSNQGVSFHKIDLSNGLNNPSSEDRSANLPDFGEPVGGVNLQGGYNMTVSVKPDNPDIVTIGATNLFRSFDGFATQPADNSDAEKDEFWIGGYDNDNDISQYPNQHPDQHVQVYDPNNPDRLWVGHDGGLSVTDNITASSVNWTDRNEGYIVTQFYDASIPEDDPDDNTGQRNIRLMGGTQDNGTPFFRFEGPQIDVPPSFDISSGDGGYSFFTENYIYVSTQNGLVRRWAIDSDGDIANPFAFVHPTVSSGQLFIHPYTIDPNDEGIMYYPSTNEQGTNSGSDDVSTLYRNTETDEISNQSSSGATQGWEELSDTQLPAGYQISALEVSRNPADVLYYGGSSGSQAPIIKRLDNASTSNSEPVDVSIPNAPAGAFVHDIAVNPANSNDVLVVMSNYNIVGLYHTADGGNSWEAVEGNLQGSSDPGSTNLGPSLRSATIVPSSSGAIYILATSTGIYATQNLDGNNTQWGRESGFDGGEPDIGFSVVENITARFSDGDVAVGTHGRGMFVGRFQGTIAVPDLPMISLNPDEARAGEPIDITATNFTFSSDISVNNVLFGESEVPAAEITEVTGSQITVIVPRNTLDPTAEDRTISVRVDRDSGTDPQAVTFTVLPPNENRLDQNFPNPFTEGDNMRIPISLQRTSDVTIVIYDVMGRRVDTPLKSERYQAGTYNIPIEFSGRASGVYIYRIVAEPTGSGNTFVSSKKFTFVK